MLRFFHDGTRQHDWITDMLQTGDRAGAQGFPIHDRGIHFVSTGAGKDRAFAGVEIRVVLHNPDRSFDRIETRSAAVQNFTTGPQGTRDSTAILLLACQNPFTAPDRTGSPMPGEADSSAAGASFPRWRLFLRRRGASAKIRSTIINC